MIQTQARCAGHAMGAKFAILLPRLDAQPIWSRFAPTSLAACLRPPRPDRVAAGKSNLVLTVCFWADDNIATSVRGGAVVLRPSFARGARNVPAAARTSNGPTQREARAHLARKRPIGFRLPIEASGVSRDAGRSDGASADVVGAGVYGRTIVAGFGHPGIYSAQGAPPLSRAMARDSGGRLRNRVSCASSSCAAAIEFAWS